MDENTAYRNPEPVTTSKCLRARGTSRAVVDRRCSQGRWQRLLPGVLLLSAEPPTRDQLLRAAVLYAGHGALLTSVDAMAAAGMHDSVAQRPAARPVHVLLPAARRVTSTEFVLCERTTRLPETQHVRGLPFAPPVRATLDAARRLPDRTSLAALLTPAINSGRCPIPALEAELDAGSQRGSALPRAVLGELRRGVETATRQRACRAVAACGLPEPTWQAPIVDGAGNTAGTIDALWEDAGLAWDHGSHAALGRDEISARRRDTILAARGVLVLCTPAGRLRDEPRAIRRSLVDAYHRAVAAA